MSIKDTAEHLRKRLAESGFVASAQHPSLPDDRKHIEVALSVLDTILETKGDRFVIATENDGVNEGWLIHEHYLAKCDIESILKRADHLGEKYGRKRIAKLTFIDDILNT